MVDDTENKVFSIIAGGKPENASTVIESTIPQNTYSIIDINGEEYQYDGFLLFTTQHIAVMRDTGVGGAIPVFVIPLDKVFLAELLEEDAEDE